MPKYKLTYFDLEARGELIRLIFAAAKVEYEDHRISLDEWPKFKSNFPFKQLPVLYIDDNPPLAQSGAIEKYLASIYGLNGGNELEAAYIEMMTSQINDVTLSQLPFFEKDEKIKNEKFDKQFQEKILPSLKYIESQMKNGEFLVGKKLSYADLFVMQIVMYFRKAFPKYLSEVPKLCALSDRTSKVEGVKQYLENRPKNLLF